MSFTTMLTTELDSLGAGSGSALSSVFDNTAAGTLYMFAGFQLSVETLTTPTSANEPIDLYIIPAPDGTNYVDGNGTTPVIPPTCYKGSFPLFQHANDQVLWLPDVILPPTKFKVFLVNSGSKAFESTGNILAMLPFGEKLT